MKDIKVLVAQLTPKLGDKQYNLSRLEDIMKEAREDGVELVVLPELYLTGYNVGGNLATLAESVEGPSIRKIQQFCKENQISIVISFPEIDDDAYYISSAYIDANGEVLGVYRKTHLFDTEKDYFKAGNEFKVINTNLGKVGMMICFDVEFPEVARALKLKEADILIIVNANMHPYQMQHNIYAQSRAMENEIPVIICNRLGVEDDLDFCGDSMVIDAHGNIISSLGNEEKSEITTLPIKQKIDMKMNYVNSRRSSMYHRLIE